MQIIKQNKNIGNWDEETKIFSKGVDKSKHLYKKLNAWGIDAEFFKDTLMPNNPRIAVYDRESGKTYITNAVVFRDQGAYLYFKGKKGYGAQVFLPLDYWKIL